MLGNASAQEWGALGERVASHPGTERDELDRLQASANAGTAVLQTVPAPVPPPATLFLGVISGDVKWTDPLWFAGITQGFYVVPTLMFLVNRKCPGMAKGFTVVAVGVLVTSLIALVAVG